MTSAMPKGWNNINHRNYGMSRQIRNVALKNVSLISISESFVLDKYFSR